MSCLLGVAAFATAPAINIYFITKDQEQTIYWATIVLYAINIVVAATWLNTAVDTLRILGIMIIFTQAALMSKVWSDEYTNMPRRTNILFLIYIISTLFHFIGFVLIHPTNIKQKRVKPQESAPPLKKTLLP